MVLSIGKPKGSGYEIQFESTNDPELQQALNGVKIEIQRRVDPAQQNIFTEPCPLVLSKKKWAQFADDYLSQVPNVDYAFREADVIVISGVRKQVQDQVRERTKKGPKPRQVSLVFEGERPEPSDPGPKKSIPTAGKEVRSRNTTSEKKEAVRIAKELRLPEKGRLYRMFRIWFEWKTCFYRYRNERLYFKNQNGELLTMKEVRDWMRRVTSNKRRKKR